MNMECMYQVNLNLICTVGDFSIKYRKIQNYESSRENVVFQIGFLTDQQIYKKPIYP